MRVITIGSDPTLFSSESTARARMRLYASAVEELHIVLPAPSGTQAVHEGNLVLHPVITSKVGRVSVLAKYAHALILEREITVVSAQDPFTFGLAALRAKSGTKAKVNVQVHTDLGELSWLRRMIALAVLRRADTIRVVSEKIKTFLTKSGVTVPITVLPIYIDLAPFQNLEHHPHPHFKKTILWIGRFEREKDPGAALLVLAGVRLLGVDAGLVMLGQGSLEHELRRRAQGLPVEFPGWQAVAPYLAQADVVLCTSRHESYGASMVEALAAGVPVVSYDVGVAREAGAIITDQKGVVAAVSEVLATETRGSLKLPLYSPEEWKERWVTSLLPGAF